MIKREIEKRQIPDFFVNDGKKITNKEEWEEHRKRVIDLFLGEEYGYLPPKIEPSIRLEEQAINFAGKAKWESVFFTFKKGTKRRTVRAELILPRGKKSPVFLAIDFLKESPNKYLPVEEILDSGFGIFKLCYESVTRDNGDFENGLCALFEGGKEKYGKIAIWSYMASICMDYLMTREDVDSKNVAIIGHSRLGKTALLTSAIDNRFVLTCVNDSGCCGASVSRGKVDGNEKIYDIVKTFPYWFKREYALYAGKENTLPFDQHMLLSLVAPRNVIIGGAKEDVWADNEGQFLSCHLASYAWELYGKSGLIHDGKMPEVGEVLTAGELGFYLREGTHFLSRDDWKIYISKFREILDNEIRE